PDTSPGPYQCGFYREDEGGANEPAMGACHYDDGRACEDQITGKECLESGGLLALDQSCSDAPPQQFFSNQNGYYVWPDTVTTGSLPAPSGCSGTGAGCADLVCPIGSAAPVPLSRDYMTSYQTQAAIAWWQQQTGPRMLTVSYNSTHTPYPPPPGSSAGTDALHGS